jgi:hypothetical protein
VPSRVWINSELMKQIKKSDSFFLVVVLFVLFLSCKSKENSLSLLKKPAIIFSYVIIIISWCGRLRRVVPSRVWINSELMKQIKKSCAKFVIKVQCRCSQVHIIVNKLLLLKVYIFYGFCGSCD